MGPPEREVPMADAAAALADAGVEFHREKPLPFLEITRNDRGEPVAPGDRVVVLQGDTSVEIDLPPLGAGLTEGGETLDLGEGIPEPYDILFASIEGAVADFCAVGERRIRDREVQRIYRRLRDRPEGSDRAPLFGHLQAVLRLFMALHPVPRKTYESLLDQLVTGVRRTAHGKDSTLYIERIQATLADLERKAAEAEAEGAAAAEAASDDAPEARV
jgi:hypothetical protein